MSLIRLMQITFKVSHALAVDARQNFDAVTCHAATSMAGTTEFRRRVTARM